MRQPYRPIEIKKTPIGDENAHSASFSIMQYIIEIKKTPIGDENDQNRCMARGDCIEIKKTPIGDENLS